MWSRIFPAIFLCIACNTPKTTPSAPNDVTPPKDAIVKDTTVDMALTPKKKKPRPPGPDDCADCHPDEVDSFANTGMGHAFYVAKGSKIIEDFDKAVIEHPITKVMYRAWIADDGRWWQEEYLADGSYRHKVEALYIVGSGNHTRSYIGKLENELVELPLTWYVGRGIWDMSPGYDQKNHLRFTRAINPACLFCHNDLTPIRDGTLSGYEEPLALGISCTRCHGDGQVHVDLRNDGKGPPEGEPDPSIINPKRLSTIEQLRICQQCHLTGEARVLNPGQRWDTYDVKTPLADFMGLFSYAQDGGGSFSISSHGSRLALSTCFKKSPGQLACSQCHNPHNRDPKQARFGGCLQCHKQEECGDKHGKAEGEDCARCHMNHGGTSDIPHVTFTDHFIQRRPDKAAPRAHTTELIDVLATDRGGKNPTLERNNLAIAHSQVTRLRNRKKHGPIAERMLRAAVKTTKDRPELWDELGRLLQLKKAMPQSAGAFAELAKLAPERVQFRIKYAEVLEALGAFDQAAEVLRAGLKTLPNSRVLLGNLANSLQRMGKLDEAEAMYARAEAANPEASITASNRGYNALQRDKLDEAERWFLEAIRRDGAKPMNAFNLGNLAMRRKKYAEARGYYNRSLRLDAEFMLGYWLRGRLSLLEGDLGGARRDIEKMIQLAPGDLRGHAEMSRIAWAAGDKAGARRALNQAISLSPRHGGLRESLRRVNLGQPPIDIIPVQH